MSPLLRLRWAYCQPGPAVNVLLSYTLQPVPRGVAKPATVPLKDHIVANKHRPAAKFSMRWRGGVLAEQRVTFGARRHDADDTNACHPKRGIPSGTGRIRSTCCLTRKPIRDRKCRAVSHRKNGLGGISNRFCLWV
jgi:hypothetical protein